MQLDHQRLAMLQAAIAGSAFYGLWTFAGLVAAGQTPTRQDYVRAAVNMACAVAAGTLTAYFMGPAILAFLPLPALKDPTAVGFIIGAVIWELAPILLKGVKTWAGKLGGGQ